MHRSCGIGGSRVRAGPYTRKPPPAFTCPSGEVYVTVQYGNNDNFAGVPEPTAPSTFFQAVPGLSLNTPANTYEHPGNNYHFGDTLYLGHPGFTFTKLRLTTRLKPNAGDALNDDILFASYPSTTTAVFRINNLPGGLNWAPPHVSVMFVFDFPNVGGVFAVHGNNIPNTVTLPPPFSGGAFFAALSANNRLDIYVEDDTGVDFVQLESCAKK
jgi:hypothetical protein